MYALGETGPGAGECTGYVRACSSDVRDGLARHLDHCRREGVDLHAPEDLLRKEWGGGNKIFFYPM